MSNPAGPGLPLHFGTVDGLRRIGVAHPGGPGSPGIAELDMRSLSDDDQMFVERFFAEHGERWRLVPRQVDGVDAMVVEVIPT